MTPTKPGTLLQKARDLDRTGEEESAKAAYLEYLQQAPEDVEALLELGNLALRTGYRRAACTAYRRAIEIDPYSPAAYVNLGNALLQDNDLAAARCEYEAALTIAPAFAPAHQGLSFVFSRMGEETASRRHRDLGFRSSPTIRVPFRGRGNALNALVLVSAAGGDFNTGSLLDRRHFDVTKVFAEYAGGAVVVPGCDVAVNAIGDADRCGEALRSAIRLASSLRVPILNPPELVLNTGRLAVAERLRTIPNVKTPRMALISSKERLRVQKVLDDYGFRYPLLLRTPGHHTGRHFVKAETAEEALPAIQSLPQGDVLAIDFLNVRNSDGFVRKYRVLAVGGELFPVHAAVSSDWKVHFFTADASGRDSHKIEDERFLADPYAVLPPGSAEMLSAIVQTIGLDYMGIDFSVDSSGRIVVFEANATMSVYPPDPAPRYAYRRPAIERVVRAFQELVSPTRARYARSV